MKPDRRDARHRAYNVAVPNNNNLWSKRVPEPSRESSLEDRKRDVARAGLNLSDERVAELMGRFDEVDATLAAIRGIDVKAFEPHAVFAPRPSDE